MNKQTQFHDKNRRFIVSKFVNLSDELINVHEILIGRDLIKMYLCALHRATFNSNYF